MPWLLASGGVVVMAVVAIFVLVLDSDAETDTPEGIAEAAVNALAGDAADADAFMSLACPEFAQQMNMLFGGERYPPGDNQFKLITEVAEVRTDDDGAIARLSVVYLRLPAEMERVFTVGERLELRLELAEENGTWCVASASLQTPD